MLGFPTSLLQLLLAFSPVTSLTTVNSAKDFLLSIFLFVLSTHYLRVNLSIANWIALYYWAPIEFFERKPNVLSAFLNRNENCVLETQLSLTR